MAIEELVEGGFVCLDDVSMFVGIPDDSVKPGVDKHFIMYYAVLVYSCHVHPSP